MMHKAELVATLLGIAAVSAWAQAGDPPSRVARLNYINGSVSFRPGSVEEWTAATLNYPLTNGDHLWTDPGATTEIHVGSTAIRMDSGTAMSFLNLDDGSLQLSVTEGSVNVRVRYLAEDESIEVDTPNVAITLLRPGDYRIDADSDKSTTGVIVRSGDAEITGGGVAFTLHARQSARLQGMDTVMQEVFAAPGPNEFDRWCEVRERREAQSESARYVPREMTGYEDLDEYGGWSDVADYGPVWTPRTVSIGWAPYRYGHWAWIEPWGWSWVDDAPWGFAPFHYGRWAYYRGGWVWVPGQMVRGVRPVYAPALVVFVGGGRFGGGGGFAAWFPLGPREAYRPRYRASDIYVRNVNREHINVANVNIVNVRYRNQNVDGAVTAVPDRAFHGGRPIAREVVSVNSREVAEAPVIGSAPMISPRRESVLLGAPRAGGPNSRYAERTVVVRNAPPPPPVAFRAKERALEANQGRPLDDSQMRGLRGEGAGRHPMVRPVPAVRVGAPAQPPVQPADPRVFGRPRPAEQPARVEQPRQVEQPRVVEQPRRVEQPRQVEPPRQVEQPRRLEQPRQFEQPRRVEQPRQVEQPRPVEQPRRVEPPRVVEQPRQVERRQEQPRQEERRQEQPRQEQPRQEQPRQIERSRPPEARPAEPRGEQRREANEERKSDRNDRKEGKKQ